MATRTGQTVSEQQDDRGTRTAQVGVEPQGDTDAALVLRVAYGDQSALGVLFGRHAPAVHGLACSVCGVADADDVVQDVFLRLWQRPERFDASRGSLRTFLMTSTHGRAVDVLRSDGARRWREAGERFRDRPSNTEVDDAAIAAVLQEDVAHVVLALPVHEREAIVLAYFGGLTYRDVAALLEQPEGTTKGRIRTGLFRMRADLESWQDAATPD